MLSLDFTDLFTNLSSAPGYFILELQHMPQWEMRKLDSIWLIQFTPFEET